MDIPHGRVMFELCLVRLWFWNLSLTLGPQLEKLSIAVCKEDSVDREQVYEYGRKSEHRLQYLCQEALVLNRQSKPSHS